MEASKSNNKDKSHNASVINNNKDGDGEMDSNNEANLPHQNYLKIEAFPIEIQERILTKLSPIDRVRIELVSRKWRGMVRTNGWGPDLELDCRCLRNLDRFQKNGFGQIVRRLVLRFKSGYICGKRDYVCDCHLEKFSEVLNFSTAFPNLVHVRIGFANTPVMRTFVEQLGQFPGLKTLSMANYAYNPKEYLEFYSPSLEVLVLDRLDSTFPMFPFLMRSLKSVWLDGRCTVEDAAFFDKLLPGCVRHVGLGNLHLTQLAFQPIRELKESLLHLSFKLPLCYFAASNSCLHSNSHSLDLSGFAQIISDFCGLVSLEVECIGPNELTLIINHCTQLEHFAFAFFAKTKVAHLNVLSMARAMDGLPTLPHLRSLDFLLTNRVNHEPMDLLVQGMLAPTMRKLADRGRIEYLSVGLSGWNNEFKRQMEILLPDDVALHFVRKCNNLRYLDHIFQDPDSGKQITQIMNDKMAKGGRSLRAYPNNLLLLPKQNVPFSHLLVAFSEKKPRNHVFCAIRAAGLTAVPPDCFFTKPLESRPAEYHSCIEEAADENWTGDSEMPFEFLF